MAKLKCPSIGREIEEFSVGCGLNHEIQKIVCGNCSKDDDISCNDEDGKPECDDGMAMMGIIENQIMHEGILFMKGLVKVWDKVEDTEISCSVCGSRSMSLAIYWPGKILEPSPIRPKEDYWFCNGECGKWYKESECIKG